MFGMILIEYQPSSLVRPGRRAARPTDRSPRRTDDRKTSSLNLSPLMLYHTPIFDILSRPDDQLSW